MWKIVNWLYKVNVINYCGFMKILFSEFLFLKYRFMVLNILVIYFEVYKEIKIFFLSIKMEMRIIKV